MIDRMIDQLIDWLIDWLSDGSIDDLLAYQSIDWLISFRFNFLLICWLTCSWIARSTYIFHAIWWTRFRILILRINLCHVFLLQKLEWTFGINRHVPFVNLSTDNQKSIFYSVGHTAVVYSYEYDGQPIEPTQILLEGLVSDARIFTAPFSSPNVHCRFLGFFRAGSSNYLHRHDQERAMARGRLHRTGLRGHRVGFAAGRVRLFADLISLSFDTVPFFKKISRKAEMFHVLSMDTWARPIKQSMHHLVEKVKVWWTFIQSINRSNDKMNQHTVYPISFIDCHTDDNCVKF